MSLEDVLQVVSERGLLVHVSTEGKCSLRGPREEITPALLEALAEYREEVVARFRPPPAREWLWRTGHRYTEHSEDNGFGNPAWHPAGAWWWRSQGEGAWEPVPGTRGEAEAPPEDI